MAERRRPDGVCPYLEVEAVEAQRDRSGEGQVLQRQFRVHRFMDADHEGVASSGQAQPVGSSQQADANLGGNAEGYSVPHQLGAVWCRDSRDGGMAGKVRFSVSIDPKINAAIERVARRHKPELSKNYIIEFALVRLLEAMDGKQLALPLVLDPVTDASR
ncbi:MULTISPECIES: hypothetical protein [unclassified Methylobacterium]|uniref:hypothetical protein n=1 Tax=unclassified Methylobacterium TaxID=2615210 RepID=UPI0036FD4027